MTPPTNLTAADIFRVVRVVLNNYEMSCCIPFRI